MSVGDVLRTKGSNVACICREATLLDAMKELTSNGIGSLLVTDGEGRIEGIITERDILRNCLHHADKVAETRVGEVMTRDVVVGLPSDSLDYVMNIMTERRIRHLPVVSEGKVVGIISIGDVVKARAEHHEVEVRHLTDYITNKYPA